MEKTHRKSESFMILSISLIALMILGVFTAIPIGKATFTTFEQYGPNVDQLLCMLYANQLVEFDDLDLGRIDLADAPLTKYYIDKWTGDNRVIMQDYGGDIGMREFDINLNETRGICTAAGTDESVMQKNIGTVFEFRHAVAHLVDRTWIISSVLQGFGTPQYTFVPAALGSWVNTNVDKHMYGPTEAAAILAAGDIHDTDGDGYLDWPGTPMGSSDKIIVDFCLRIEDTPGRYEAGLALIAELQAQGFYVPVWNAVGSVQARKWWSAGKGAVIYTGGWSLSRDPDFLYDYFHGSQYWHPGRPPNVAHVNDPELNGYLEGIKFALSRTEALPNCLEAQRVMADKVLVVPAWSASAPKAVRSRYTGGTNEAPVTPDDGENQYRGRDWKGMANEAGNGLNSWFSTLGAHVNDAYDRPISGGVLRYGLSTYEFGQLNPLYASGQLDWEILGRTYESLIAVNPYDLSEDLEWVAKRWEVGVWINPEAGEAAKLVLELREDVYWHDGQQLDADDIIFNLQDLVNILESRALPTPWYYSKIMDVNSVIKLDQYTVEVRMNLKSFFALHWIGEVPILPEHIWRTIVTSGDPTTFSPDPQIIGCGPFKVYPHSIDYTAWDYYVPSQYCKMDKNPNYFQNSPVRATAHVGASGGAPKLVLTFSDFCPYTMDLEVTATVTGHSDAAKTTPVWGPNVYNFAWTGLNPPPDSDGSVPTVVRGLIDLTGVPKGTYLKTQLAMTMKISGVTVWTKSVTLDPVTYGYAVPGDITNDGYIDVRDSVHLSFHFGLKAYVWPEDDLNLNNIINVQDALVLMANWGVFPPDKPSPPGPTTIYVDPSMNGPGDFSVDVMVANVSQLYGYEFKVLFDPNLLYVTGISNVGEIFPTPPGFNVWKSEIGADYVWIAVTLSYSQAGGVSGDGRLATLNFTPVGTGACYLDLANTVLSDPHSQSIDHTALDGYFSNLPQTTMLADLVKRKSNNKPGERIFKISVHGTTQTLYGEVENLGTVPILTRVRFEVYDEAGLPPPGGIMYSATTLLAPGQSAVLTAGMPINPSMLGKWYVTNYCEYDSNGDGTLDAQGSRTMSYDFKVQQ